MLVKSGHLIQLKNTETGRVENTEFIGLITDEDNKSIGFMTGNGPYLIGLWEVYGLKN
jgi:hypothetical protein